MNRNTKRVEQLLAATKENQRLVREEIADGVAMDHIRHDLERHEHFLSARLKDVQQHNEQVNQS